MSIGRLAPRLVLAVLLVGAIVWAISAREHFDAAGVASAIRALGIWGPFAYMALYIAGTVLLVPGAILGLAGGALFGPVWGAAYTLVAATIGASLAFLIARYLASDWVAAKVGGRVRQLIEGVEAEGWRFVAFVRLVPFFPFDVLNYALGLTRIRFRDYALASFVCMAPGTIAYTYLGYAGREALAGGEAMVQKILLALGFLAVLAFVPRLVRRLRAGKAVSPPAKSEAGVSWIEAPELGERLARQPAPIILDVRGPDEFNGELGHIAGARNISFGEFAQRLHDLDRFKDDAMVLVCRTQMRSAKAAALLTEAGFRDVRVLRGGMVEWARQRRPVDGPPT